MKIGFISVGKRNQTPDLRITNAASKISYRLLNLRLTILVYLIDFKYVDSQSTVLVRSTESYGTANNPT